MRDSLDPSACVCAECFDDPDLQAFIEGNAEPGVDVCAFCGDEGADQIVCKFRELMSHIKACIEEHYDLAGNCLGWEGREGGWQGAPHWDTPDLLRDQIGIGLPQDTSDSLFWAMCSYLGHTDWCRRNPYGESRLDALRFDWEEFTHVVRYHTRFFVDTCRKLKDPILASDRANPRNFLKAIGDAAVRLDLFADLPRDQVLYRVRYHGSSPAFTLPGELGPPKCETAFVSNRMSPPGIVMFYGALDQQTALAETCKESGNYSVGRFRILRPLRVLDLTRVPEPPGFFAESPDSREWSRHEALFFEEFVNDLTQPIERDDRVHLEYVPTQIVMEYFRRRFHRDLKAVPVDGVVYASARQRGGVALALFCDRAHIAGIDDDEGKFGPSDEAPWLELVGAESVLVSPEAAAKMTAPLVEDA